ncbi:MAG: diaminopimelate epimerase [Firmicutes bacterium]|nr:diaminopimelate epimerase [Bacillota bacterium]
MDFLKYQGAGNDFVLFSNMDRSVKKYSELARKICDRRFGVGADGLIAAEPSDTADVRMAFFNADGSEAGMRGNGIRCFAKFVMDHGIVTKDTFTVETGDGIKVLESLEKGEAESRFRVDMGPVPAFSQFDVAVDQDQIDGNDDIEEMQTAFTHFGVPHAVIVIDEPDAGMPALDRLAFRYGSYMEHAPVFAPARTNVNFIRMISSDHIMVSTWERGAGKTLACGTGACSSAAAAREYLGCGDMVRVTMPGGEVTVTFKDGRVFMEGSAGLTFRGSIDL